MIRFKNKLPIFVALDVDDEKTALNYAELLHPYVLGFKVGPRLYFRSSPSLIKQLSKLGPIFLDFKFYDIPSTMTASVRACFDQGIQYVTVHAQAGKTALSLLADLEQSYKGQKVLGVTVLTSQPQTQEVFTLAEAVYESGLSGLVSSAHEVKELRKKYKNLFIVTPGIRFTDTNQSIENEDQKRIATPAFALSQGADALVMGRSILKAEDPEKILQGIYTSL
ncbi:MAG: orotidine-5'-phosphate decarboxylase [Bdellovibrionales bacterium]|nr:orotidine-5'-phosphate decarboxylase [Bdellovibrionales bacterium]